MWAGSVLRIFYTCPYFIVCKNVSSLLTHAVNTRWTYTTELSSISHAAKAYAHLLQPYKRASCRGLRVRSTQYRSYVYIYVIVSFCSWEERPSDSASVVLLTALTNVCLAVLILVGPSWRPSWSPWCNWSLRCDCVPSLMNVRWNSSCRRIQIHI